ncbi:hypothetical protein ACH4GZ_38685 [Streptomyces hygroscopicus]|uniref:hypothetical protein n=1 Tax=Streptomyces hygroscopicus TaxID=1912 RepID=UPI00379655BF
MTDQPKHRALLARLEAERAHHESCTALSSVEEAGIAHSGMAAGLHIAALRTVEVYEGPEAAAAYMQRTASGHSEGVSTTDTLPTDEDFLVAVETALESRLLPTPGIGVLDDTRSAVMRALVPLVDQLRADRDRLAAKVVEFDNAITWHTTCLSCSRVLDSCYRETVRAEQAEAAVERVREVPDHPLSRPAPSPVDQVGYVNGWMAAINEVRAALAAPDAEQGSSGHVYLSTSCLHAREPGREDLHGYCQGKTGMVGPKTPAVCKFCKSPCICSCHREAL